MPGDARRTSSNGDQSRHHPNERGFARAVRAEQSEDFFFFHREGNIVYRSELAVLLHDVFHFNRIFGTAMAVVRSTIAAGSAVPFEICNH